MMLALDGTENKGKSLIFTYIFCYCTLRWMVHQLGKLLSNKVRKSPPFKFILYSLDGIRIIFC